MRLHIFLALPLIGLTLMGQGCAAPPASPQVAEPFKNPTLAPVLQFTQGFGKLPKIEIPAGRAKVTLIPELPKLSKTVTVLKLRQGTPDDAVLRSLTNALSIPAGILSNFPHTTEMLLNWTDDQGYKWTYRATERRLEFWGTATSGPLTIKTLKPYNEVVATANSFIFSRGMPTQLYRQGLIMPDWNLWWENATTKGLCMDSSAVESVHAVAASESLLSGGPPPLVPAKGGACVTPEFPARSIVRYRALIDERDVVRPDGSYWNGAEIVVDTARGAVASGQITMYYDPERSDYPALDADKVKGLLLQGGLSGANGDMTMNTLDFVFLRLEDTSHDPHDVYLIPSLMAKGVRALPDGGSEPFNIVVPLLAQ